MKPPFPTPDPRPDLPADEPRTHPAAGKTFSAWIPALLFLLGWMSADFAVGAVVNRSDVVFMYQADRAIYAQYGATVLAWGGKPTPKSLAEAAGVKFFGSVGMVTEFARYYDRFPETYEQGLCRDIQNQPVKVPWLTDHQHHGKPYWWCCTQQPLFRKYLTERVVETVQAGAAGLHIDDHLGTAGGLWLGGVLLRPLPRGVPRLSEIAA